MSASDEVSPRVIPAQLNYLAIYNPTLATSEETEPDQIVFYYSKNDSERRRGKAKQARPKEAETQDQYDRLRRIGLAQGMVNFARTFSDGEPVDSVETDKHRIVLKELENDWWILASIDLTVLPKLRSKLSSSADKSRESPVEYSTREVSPPAILLQQLTTAHRVFLLHHGASLSAIFVRLARDRFCELLDSYWKRFCRSWDVLLHGNPAVEIFDGVKLAAGGELGIGVGEEEWGSGEREVLEGLVRYTEGLVDLTVARFGGPYTLAEYADAEEQQDDVVEEQRWLGGREVAGAADGLLFSGLGSLTRHSLRDVCSWVQTIYTLGEDAYGVKDNPGAGRRRWRRKKAAPVDKAEQEKTHSAQSTDVNTQVPDAATSPQESTDNNDRPQDEAGIDIPPAIVVTDTDTPPKGASDGTDAKTSKPEMSDANSTYALADPEVWKYYLTFGYGSSWGKSTKDERLNKKEEEKAENKDKTKQQEQSDHSAKDTSVDDKGPALDAQNDTSSATKQKSEGYFLIGLKGDLNGMQQASHSEEDLVSDDQDWNNRISIRTLHVEVYEKDEEEEDNDEQPIPKRPTSPGSDDTIRSFVAKSRTASTKRLRVVVYLHKPFIFTLLFDPNTSSLSYQELFHNLHSNLRQLHKPLLASTSPDNVASRLYSALNPNSSPQNISSPRPSILDLIFDPSTLTVRTSIPNIPLPGTLAAEGFPPASSKPASAHTWTRLEALNVHSQILNTYIDTRRQTSERERTAKTNRGWWVAWLRLPTTMSPKGQDAMEDASSGRDYKEAVLVRKGGNTTRHGGSSRFGRRESSGGGLGRFIGVGTGAGEEAGSAWNPARLAEGIGVDARRYVESLLSLNR